MSHWLAPAKHKCIQERKGRKAEDVAPYGFTVAYQAGVAVNG